jgi:hypothetical protein
MKSYSRGHFIKLPFISIEFITNNKYTNSNQQTNFIRMYAIHSSNHNLYVQRNMKITNSVCQKPSLKAKGHVTEHLYYVSQLELIYPYLVWQQN